MMADWVPAHVSFDQHGRRILDTARGILIGLRRCTSESAFHELLSAAERHQVPLFAMAWALVHLAGNGGKLPHRFVDAHWAAHHEWGQLFTEPALSTC